MGRYFRFIAISISIISGSLFLKGCNGPLQQQLAMLTTQSQTSMTVQTQLQGIVMQLQNLQSRLPFISSVSQGYTIYQTLTQVQTQLLGGASGSLPSTQVTVQVVTEQISVLTSYLNGLSQQVPMMTHQQLALLAPKLQMANAAITSAGVGVGFGMSSSGYIPGSNMGIGMPNMSGMGMSGMGMSGTGGIPIGGANMGIGGIGLGNW